MLLFSYANWDEILRVCLGLCGNVMDDREGIKNDNLRQLGGIPGETGGNAKPLINQPAEALEEEHHVTTV
jgi:hypothetical protein